MNNKTDLKTVTFKVKADDKLLLEAQAREAGYHEISEYIRDTLFNHSKSISPLNNSQIQELVKISVNTMWDVKYLAEDLLRLAHKDRSVNEVNKIIQDFMTKGLIRRNKMLEEIAEIK